MMIIILILLGILAITTVVGGGGLYYWISQKKPDDELPGPDPGPGGPDPGGPDPGGPDPGGPDPGPGGPGPTITRPNPIDDPNVIFNGDVLIIEGNNNDLMVKEVGPSSFGVTQNHKDNLEPGCESSSPPCHYWYIVKVGSDGTINKDPNAPINNADTVRIYHLGARDKFLMTNKSDLGTTCQHPPCIFNIQKKNISQGAIQVGEEVYFQRVNSNMRVTYITTHSNQLEFTSSQPNSSYWTLRKINNQSYRNSAHSIMQTL